MKWFKHEAAANMDAKLQEVLLDYGLEGYGLYWYCLELIAGKVEPGRLTFELEHDCRVIARNTGSTSQRVQEMMTRFVDLGLFENAQGTITCLKMAKVSDDYTAKLIRTEQQSQQPQAIENKGVLETPTNSEKVSLEENRTEENRTEHTDASADACLFDQVWQAYPKRQGGNPKQAALAKYKALIRKGYTHEQLMTAVKQYSKLIVQEKTHPQFVKQACTFFGPGGHVDDMLSIYAQEQAKRAVNQQKYVTAVVVEKTMSDEARAQFKALREG